ncbi:MAG: HEAT repeat domain-containing protein, partial [Terriglobia bacterium]
ASESRENGNRGPVRPLRKLQPFSRAKSAENLGRIRHRESWPLLVNALSDRSGEVRAVALRSLGALAEPRSFASLIECVRANVNSGRPEFSERSLRSALTGFPPEVAAELLPVLQDPNPRLRELAARILRDMLGNRGHALAPQLASCIMDQLARDPSEEVRALAAGLLEFVAPDDQEAARRIIELTGDREWIVRLHAVRALASRRDPGCLARLSALASDRHWRVREAAVHGLALCGSAGVDAALDLLLSTRDAYAAEQIAEELKASGALAGLAARSGEPGHERDAEALKKLMRIGAAGAAQAVSGDGAGREKVFAEAPKRLAAIAGASAASPPSLQKESPRSETP